MDVAMGEARRTAGGPVRAGRRHQARKAMAGSQRPYAGMTDLPVQAASGPGAGAATTSSTSTGGEDVAMVLEPTPRAGRRGPRASPYAVSRRAERQRAMVVAVPDDQRIEVMVQGWNQASKNQPQRVVTFLERRADPNPSPDDGAKTVCIVGHVVRHQHLILFVNHMAAAEQLKKLSGIKLGGTKLHISVPVANRGDGGAAGGPGDGGPRADRVPLVRQALLSRWNAATQTLQLAQFATEPALKQGGITQPFPSAAKSPLGAVMVKLMHDVAPTARTLILARNAVSSLAVLPGLATALPHLTHLDLTATRIASLADLESLRHAGIRDLILTDTALFRRHAKTASLQIKLHTALLALFPQLQTLNGKPVVREGLPLVLGMTVDAETASASTTATPSASAAAATVPPPFSTIPPPLGTAMHTLWRNWLQLIDTPSLRSSHALGQLYVPDAEIVLIFDGPAEGRPRRARDMHWRHVAQRLAARPAPDAAGANAAAASLADALSQLATLPPLRHSGDPLGLPSLPQSVSPLGPHTFLLTFAGVFREDERPCTQRHGAHQWVVETAATHPTAAGLPWCRIRHQTWTVTDPEAPAVNAAAAAPSPVVTPAPLPPALAHLAYADGAKVLALSERTGLQYEWAIRCLQEADGDLDRAHTFFTNAKASLPAEAFVADS
ncbi:hypothetical protein CXG81DRAFT_19571 [Caulochytrium protostelioides]|uniref:TAP-C domain-containing protein n=1 Tax=Caulochytrium protostelioides TaxID=1555241 RepID=A0A4P9X619_9FUNG|nr:hypothetical protein CXG81DRAFT_19571 [Caulochytrium protostelioides]|eukprot:RKP00460.1 hypothetical protein CXG81DRAFT_19571 [Caulochytrium protostelioides]